MNYFAKEQVIKIHSALIVKIGGIDGVRELDLLDSSLQSNFKPLTVKNFIRRC